MPPRKPHRDPLDDAMAYAASQPSEETDAAATRQHVDILRGMGLHPLGRWLQAETRPRADLPPPEPEVYNCQTCGDIGWLRTGKPLDHPDFGKMVPCPACNGPLSPEEIAKRLIAASNIPEHYRNYTLDRYNYAWVGDPEVQVKIGGFIRGAIRSLTIVGSVGSGKTHLAVGTALRCAELGYTIYFQWIPKLLQDIRATYSVNEAEERQEMAESDYLRPLFQHDVVVLDDLAAIQLRGDGKGSQWAQNILNLIIGERYQHNQQTIATVDVALPLATRTVSRLYDAAGAIIEIRSRVDRRRRGNSG